MKKLSIVIPCINEEESLSLSLKTLFEGLQRKEESIEIEYILVDDGCSKERKDELLSLYQERNDIVLVSLSRFFAIDNALLAGLKVASGDFFITLDPSFKGSIPVLPEILAKLQEGYDVVNPKNEKGKEVSAFITKINKAFKIINKAEGKEVFPSDVTYLRGMSKRVVNELLSIQESDRILLSEIPLIGFKTVDLPYSGEETKEEKNKSSKKNKNLVYHLLSTASSSPLYWPILYSVFSGILFLFFFTAMLVCYILICSGVTFLPSISFYQTMFLISIILLGSSLLIFFIGILGIYLHNILINTRNHPDYIIEEVKTPLDKEKEPK